MGTEIGRLRGSSFRGTVTAGDGSNQLEKGGKCEQICECERGKGKGSRGRRDAKRKDPARTILH